MTASAQSACAEIEKHKEEIKLALAQEGNSAGAFMKNLADNTTFGGLVKNMKAKNEAEAIVVADVVDQLHQRLKIGLCLARKADNKIRGNGDLGSHFT